jgi:hypothetical protein
MTDVQVRDPAADDAGRGQRGVTAAQATDRPATGDATRGDSKRAWSGRSATAKTLGLLAFVVLAFLALDFVFHATGAVNVGVAAFIFTVGSFLASPFVGIFKTTYASQGNLLVWTDVLAMAVYAGVALLVATVVSNVIGSYRKRAA